MVQNQYTNISGVESLWDSHTVGASGTTSTQAAVRYYQVKVTGGTVESNATQAFTWSPDATVHRFMPSVAVDRAGNMALGYSASSASLNPAIRYAEHWRATRPTRSANGDLADRRHRIAIRHMRPEHLRALGRLQLMSLDPDGCTFWMSNEYYAVNGLNWQTRIGAFKYPRARPLRADRCKARSPRRPAARRFPERPSPRQPHDDDERQRRLFVQRYPSGHVSFAHRCRRRFHHRHDVIHRRHKRRNDNQGFFARYGADVRMPG
jgi:hypothetical protein